MNNLLELKRFLEDNINCLCLYNNKEDNYKDKLGNDLLKINSSVLSKWSKCQYIHLVL